LRAGIVNVQIERGSPGQPAVAAVAQISGKIGLAEAGRRDNSTAKDLL
jgi:hypothetical protein